MEAIVVGGAALFILAEAIFRFISATATMPTRADPSSASIIVGTVESGNTDTFSPRKTGRSAQRFCCTGHRQQFWVAPLDDESDRSGPTLGRLLEGISRERA